MPLNKKSPLSLSLSLSLAPVQEIWEVWNNPSLVLLPGLLWPGVVVHVMVLSMGKKEVLKLFVFDKTMCK